MGISLSQHSNRAELQARRCFKYQIDTDGAGMVHTTHQWKHSASQDVVWVNNPRLGSNSKECQVHGGPDESEVVMQGVTVFTYSLMPTDVKGSRFTGQDARGNRGVSLNVASYGAGGRWA
jgi:hypothetical protein